MSACATCGSALHRLYLVVGKRNRSCVSGLTGWPQTVDAAQLLAQLGLETC